jgi:thiol-disulfide isomerase/thioredoxin
MPGKRLIAAMTVAVALALGASTTSGAGVIPASNDDRLQRLTQAFGTFDARDMEGRRWTTAALRGRVVVLDFWATWCAPCLAEIPSLRRLHKRFAPDRVQIIGVSLDVTDRRTFVAWLNRHRVDWPQVRAEQGYDSVLAEQFGVASLPASVLVGPDGRVVALNLRGERLVSAVDQLLSGSQPTR